jgi:hypothetical protein
MHATFRQHHATDAGRPIRGTFYPSDGPSGGSVGSVVPKLIAILVAMAVLRTVAKHHHGGGRSMRSRRREAIAELHRELHADDTTAGESVPA